MAEQELWLLREAHRWGGMALARAREVRDQEAIVQRLRREGGCRALLLEFARAFGASDREVETAEPLLGTMALTNYLCWTAAFGTAGEQDAALAACESVREPLHARLMKGLRAHYGLPSQPLEFLAGHPAGAAGKEVVAAQNLVAHAATPQARADICRAARLVYHYQRLLLDTLLASA